jgi:hypothetical protein
LLNNFQFDENLPRPKLTGTGERTFGDSSSVRINTISEKHFSGYYHFGFMVQCATDSFFTKDLDCWTRDATPGDSNYDKLDTIARFRGLPTGEDIYYRAYALATKVSGGVPVKGEASEIIHSYQIEPDTDRAHCFPNPFNPNNGEKTTIVLRAELDKGKTLKIYDLYGNLVRILESSDANGQIRFSWDGRNGNGVPVAPGGYIAIPKECDKDECRVKIAVWYRK